MNNMTEGITPKQATIILIELIASRHGGFVYSIEFDNGWRCYVDPDNNNYRNWRNICEKELLVTVKGLRAKSKRKRLYNADSRIQIVYDKPKQMLKQYDKLFGTQPQVKDLAIEPQHAIEWKHMQWLKDQIEHAEDMPQVEVVQMPDDNLVVDEMHIKDDQSLYIIPIALPY